ncbi:NfeD family protein [Alteribacillus iranensis]|uniref:Membrane-bound serine protease (ClpP class) n=1 Tax=Alteribacillus iranensis TaxID=930128 RepID=A0A1I1ZAZ9_9BACI|nr:membrane-bound serine protease (ClpP class) [Alteribacillus iranensis]
MFQTRLLASTLACVFALLFFLNNAINVSADTTAPPGDVVYIVPVEQTVERGLEAFLERSVQDAEDEGADHIIFEIDTPGGAVDAAGNIASIFRNTDIHTTAFVTNQAMSAGAFLALNADEIAMAPGTEMGAAQVIDGSGNAAGDKAQSAWVANMKGAAELNDRDPIYAIAMADPTVDLAEYRAGEGELLSLTASEAYEVGYAEYVVENREELLSVLGFEDAHIQEADISIAEHIARIVTHPVVIPILLSLGSLGLILELYSPGFGIPGIMGASALFLFFFGHTIAGFAGIESIIMFIAGLVLILIEIFVPGFGVFGILGIGAIIASMFFASFSAVHMIISILIAALLSIVAIAMLFKTFGKKGPMKKLVLQDSFSSDEGYVSHTSRDELIGKVGSSLTPLRPSGSILVEEERLDAVSEGGYIEENQKVKIIEVQGARIIVRKSE